MSYRLFCCLHLSVWAIAGRELGTLSIRVHNSLTVHANLWALKFDNFSEFQNVISDSLHPTPEHYYDVLRTKIVIYLLLILTHHCWTSKAITTKFYVTWKNILNRNSCLYLHLYLHLKNSTFGNLLMKKPGNWFAIVKICEKHPSEKEILSKATRIFTYNVTLQLQFLVSAGAT